jgi:hypothetical protein
MDATSIQHVDERIHDHQAMTSTALYQENPFLAEKQTANSSELFPFGYSLSAVT